MTVYVSPEGLKKLQDELVRHETALRDLRRDKTVAYTDSGDTWHDNPYFNKLQQDEVGLAKKIADLQRMIGEARIFVAEPRSIDKVRIGSIVRFSRTYEKTGEQTDEVWEIVGFGETDVEKNRAGYNSPMAQALMGMIPGETKNGTLPKGLVEYEVIELYSDWDSVPR